MCSKPCHLSTHIRFNAAPRLQTRESFCLIVWMASCAMRRTVLYRKSQLLTLSLLLAAWSFSLFAARAASMDVVLVVDTSGSMAWDVEGRKKSDPKFQAPPRIDRVIDALKTYAGKLPEGTRLRLISFNSGVKTNREFIVSEKTRGELVAAISMLKGEVKSGDTWLWEAMREGIKAAESYAAQDPDLTATLYVLTDGEYDNKAPTEQISLAKVLNESKSLGGESLYGSLVLLGKLKSQGGAFREEYLQQLKDQAGTRCDVQLDEDFDPLFPPVLLVPQEKIVPKQKVVVIEGSDAQFARVEWTLDGKPAGTKRVLEFTPEKFGRYAVTFRGFDDKGRRARARMVLNVGQEQVKAIPKISIDNKPFDSVDAIIQGQRMDLSHDSTGPVAKVTWNINGNETEATSLNSVLNRIGPYKISLTVESSSGPSGEVTRSTSQPIVFEVVAPRLMAQPEVTVNGKPLSGAGAIHPGDMLTLTSRNTANAEAFEWQIGDETLSGQTVNWPVPSAGTFQIIHTVAGVTSGDEAPQKDTAAPIAITAVDPELIAVAEVLHRGKPYSQSSNIYAGDTLQLVSKSSGPVQSATWTVNGEKISGNSVSWPIPAPGDIEICLKVQGQNPGQVDESLPLKVFAKKRPPVWMLWALGLAELGILGFFAWLLTGNQVRDYRLIVANGPRPQIRKFFSRFSKTATIPFNKMLKGKEYWKKAPDRDALVISRQSVAKGPAAKLACTFAPARRGTGDVQFGESKAATNTERFYLLEDGRNPDDVQTVEFTLQSGKKPYGDFVLLCMVATALAAAFFWFYLKAYPTL